MEAGRDNPSAEDLAEVRALAAVNIPDCILLVDLYLTGGTKNRDPKLDLEGARALVHEGQRWSVALSDEEGTRLVLERPSQVGIDLGAPHSEGARQGWKAIDTEISQASPDMADVVGIPKWKQELVNELKNLEPKGKGPSDG